LPLSTGLYKERERERERERARKDLAAVDREADDFAIPHRALLCRIYALCSAASMSVPI